MSVFEPEPTEVVGFTVDLDGIETSLQPVRIPSISTAETGGSGSEAWGETTYQDLELEGPFEPDNTLLRDWRDEVLAGDEEGLKEVTITVFDREGSSVYEWTFEDAWITYYDPLEIRESNRGYTRVAVSYASVDEQEL